MELSAIRLGRMSSSSLSLPLLFAVWFCTGGGVLVAASQFDIDHSEFLKCADQYCLGKNYSKLDVPFNDEGRVDIAVDLDVLQILEVDDIKFTVSFSMYFGVSGDREKKSVV